jgi:hypothetical protein
MRWVNNFKIVTAQQTKVAYNYENAKRKLLKTKATMWFNKICESNLFTYCLCI